MKLLLLFWSSRKIARIIAFDKNDKTKTKTKNLSHLKPFEFAIAIYIRCASALESVLYWNISNFFHRVDTRWEEGSFMKVG